MSTDPSDTSLVTIVIPPENNQTVTSTRATTPEPFLKGSDIRKRLSWLHIVAWFVAVIAIAVLLGLLVRSRNELQGLRQSFLSGTLPESEASKNEAAACNQTESTLIRNAASLQFMNISQDPCQDFVAFSCQGFQNDNYIPDPEYLQNSVALMCLKRRENELTRILSNDRVLDLEAYLNERPGNKEVYGGVVSFYQSCISTTTNWLASIIPSAALNTEYDDNVNKALLDTKALITSRILNINRSETFWKADLVKEVMLQSPNQLTQLYGQRSMDGTYATTWLFDIGLFMVYRPDAQGILALLPQGKPAITMFSRPQVTDYYRYRMAQILSNYVYPTMPFNNVLGIAGAIVNLERNLTSFMLSRPVEYDENWPKYNASKLDSLYPNIFGVQGGWAHFLRGMNVGERTIKEGIHVTSTAYLAQLNNLLATVSSSTLIHYAAYLSLVQTALVSQLQGLVFPGVAYNLLPSERTPGSLFDLSRSRLRKRVRADDESDTEEPQMDFSMYGIPWDPYTNFFTSNDTDFPSFESSSDPKMQAIEDIIQVPNCIDQTLLRFGSAVAVYFEQVVLGDRRNDLQTVVNNVHDAYKRRIMDPSVETWLDQESRIRAVDKLEAMEMMIAAPTAFRENIHQFANRFYSFDEYQPTTGNYFVNGFMYNYYLNKLPDDFDQMDFSHWYAYLTVDWTAVNAFYLPFFNKLILPMGFLQHPVYSAGNTMAMTYGSIGSIIGHEITHALDTQGILFDLYGNSAGRMIMSQNSMNAFSQKSSCFSSYMDRYVLRGTSINGLRTLAENIADNGGIKASWDAYRNALNNTEKADRQCAAAGLSRFNADQTFWIAYAQVWCSKMDTDEEYARAMGGVHTVATKRPNVAVALVEEFAQTWQCPLGSPMNPSDSYGKCTLWRRSLK